MTKGLEAITGMTYPGRLIILGRSPDGESIVVVYAITGRSPSSQARRIEFEQMRAVVKPTDEVLLRTGNPELLIYPAIMISQRIAVSNGLQTPSIHGVFDTGLGPAGLLTQALMDWVYEPDDPNFTPRISGSVVSPATAALSILRRDRGGGCLKNYFEFFLRAGAGKMISTYSGENVNPLPSFRGEPLDVELKGVTAKQTAEAVYAALAPEDPEKDFRVAVACAFIQDLEHEVLERCVVNRHERMEPNE